MAPQNRKSVHTSQLVASLLARSSQDLSSTSSSTSARNSAPPPLQQMLPLTSLTPVMLNPPQIKIPSWILKTLEWVEWLEENPNRLHEVEEVGIDDDFFADTNIVARTPADKVAGLKKVCHILIQKKTEAESIKKQISFMQVDIKQNNQHNVEQSEHMEQVRIYNRKKWISMSLEEGATHEEAEKIADQMEIEYNENIETQNKNGYRYFCGHCSKANIKDDRARGLETVNLRRDGFEQIEARFSSEMQAGGLESNELVPRRSKRIPAMNGTKQGASGSAAEKKNESCSPSKKQRIDVGVLTKKGTKSKKTRCGVRGSGKMSIGRKAKK